MCALQLLLVYAEMRMILFCNRSLWYECTCVCYWKANLSGWHSRPHISNWSCKLNLV